MQFEYRYAGKSHIFTGADFDYVCGKRDTFPGTPTEKYIAACARQAFTKMRKTEHRELMRGMLHVLSRPTPSP